jgi:hypothetical protein
LLIRIGFSGLGIICGIAGHLAGFDIPDSPVHELFELTVSKVVTVFILALRFYLSLSQADRLMLGAHL